MKFLFLFFSLSICASYHFVELTNGKWQMINLMLAHTHTHTHTSTLSADKSKSYEYDGIFSIGFSSYYFPANLWECLRIQRKIISHIEKSCNGNGSSNRPCHFQNIPLWLNSKIYLREQEMKYFRWICCFIFFSFSFGFTEKYIRQRHFGLSLRVYEWMWFSWFHKSDDVNR